MPRKLCWIEVDEEGKAVGPLECFGLSSLVQRNVIEALPDATEEVVEAVARHRHEAQMQAVEAACDLVPPTWDEIGEEDRTLVRDDARSLITRLASAPPNKETTDA